MKSLIGRVGGKNRLKKRLVDYYFPDNYENMTIIIAKKQKNYLRTTRLVI